MHQMILSRRSSPSIMDKWVRRLWAEHRYTSLAGQQRLGRGEQCTHIRTICKYDKTTLLAVILSVQSSGPDRCTYEIHILLLGLHCLQSPVCMNPLLQSAQEMRDNRFRLHLRYHVYVYVTVVPWASSVYGICP